MPININLNTRTILGKIKARSQLSRIYTEDGRIVINEIPVLKGCLSDENKLAGWTIDAENLVQDVPTGLWQQMVDERSILPVPAITGSGIATSATCDSRTKDRTKLVGQIFHDSWVIDLITLNDEVRKDRVRNWWFLILGTPILLAALVLGLKVLNK